MADAAVAIFIDAPATAATRGVSDSVHSIPLSSKRALCGPAKSFRRCLDCILLQELFTYVALILVLKQCPPLRLQRPVVGSVP